MENGDVGVVTPKSEDPIRDAPKIEEPKIDVDDIIVVGNPREDYGDMEELINSIMEYGVQESIKIKPIMPNGKAELVFGHRRVAACKKAVERFINAGNQERADKIRKISYNFFEGTKEDLAVIKLIENDKHKHLNPVEEGKAYKKFMEEHKKNTEYIAKKLSKDKLYVQKRLEIIKLPDFVKEALIQNKIRIGHALALARLNSENEMKQKLKRILDDKLSVAGTVDILKNYNTDLSKAQFDKTECKTCQFNGSTQGQLFETGTVLKGNCLNEKCFFNKTREYIAQLKKEYKEKGIRILTDEDFENLRYHENISDYNMPANDLYKKKCKKGCEKFAVYFRKDYHSDIEIEELCLNPRCFRGVTKTDEDPKEKAKRLIQKAKDRLQGNVALYKREFLIDKATELIKPSTKETKAFTLHTLLSKYDAYKTNEVVEDILKEIGVEHYADADLFSKMVELDETKIGELTTRIVTLHLPEMFNLSELSKASESFGVNLEKHFVITEEYLKPYTKQQLINLAKEIGLHKYLIEKGKPDWVNGKRPELIAVFFKEVFDLKGKVPKVMIKDENTC